MPLPLVLLTFVVLSQNSAPQAPPVPPAPPVEDWPWPAKIGVRTLADELGRPIAPQVVLVPDGATFLDEVSKWTPQARWPVLFDEDRFAPMFVRAFKPERVVRRASVGALPADRAARESALRALAARSTKDRAPAPCVAVTSVDDPAWTAAAALSAGRGMAIAFVDGAFGAPNDVLGADDFAKLDNALNTAITSLGRSWRELGDDIDAIAMCRSLAAKAVPNLDPRVRPALPANAPGKIDDPIAVTDALARKPDGERSAIVGWIFGDEARSAYMAMSSMFLVRKDIMFHSGYAASEPWSLFDPAPAAAQMKGEGFDTSVTTGKQAGLANWLRLLMGGFTCDVLVMNSSGDPDWFSLADNDRAHASDVPFLNRPTAVYLVHSWSLARPDDRATVGGRLLEHGAYAYFGSVQEPFLFAFVPPSALARRCIGLGPFLVSSRSLEGAFDKVWRVTAIGDPLALLVPPSKRAIPAAPLPDVAGEQLTDAARSRMKAFAKDGVAADASEAMRLLVLIGEDRLASDFWLAAKQRGAAASVAASALGPLFRQRSFDEFVAAFKACPKHASADFDMLWQLSTPRVSSLDQDTLLLLRRSLRGPDPSVDLARLLPGIDRSMGRRASDAIVKEELDRATDPGVRDRISGLLRR